mmetsp:Transcript_37180/g.100500  ORF Transcript_37180/g.100500 Transcript_37180/m.100500 type:complete len:210 (+) Transcript_37180:1504-2133(+)
MRVPSWLAHTEILRSPAEKPPIFLMVLVIMISCPSEALRMVEMSTSAPPIKSSCSPKSLSNSCSRNLTCRITLRSGTIISGSPITSSSSSPSSSSGSTFPYSLLASLGVAGSAFSGFGIVSPYTSSSSWQLLSVRFTRNPLKSSSFFFFANCCANNWLMDDPRFLVEKGWVKSKFITLRWVEPHSQCSPASSTHSVLYCWFQGVSVTTK